MAINYRAKVVANALAEVGTLGGSYSGDDKYIKYYNQIAGTSFDVDTTPWCAIFDSYILRTSGVPTSVCPNFSSCTNFRNNYMIPKGIYHKAGSGYIPQAGDLIFFDWDLSGNCDHTGIVEKVLNNLVYTIEGNTKGGYTTYGVRHKSYATTYKYFAGFCAIPYESISGNSVSTTTCPYTKPTTNVRNGQSGGAVYWVQWHLINYQGYDIDLDGIFGNDTLAAVKDFQSKCGLIVDGIVGTNTIAKLQIKNAVSSSNSNSNSSNNTTSTGSTSSTTTTSNTYSTYIKKFQIWLNTKYKAGLVVDGVYGTNSKKAAIKALQTILKNEYKKNITIDGVFGTATKNACVNIEYPDKGNLVYVAQGMLYGRRYSANGFDGIFGTGMRTTVRQFQTNKKLDSDGIIGKNTWTALANG